MLAAAIIVFREVLEAALVAGIVLAATRGLARSRAWISAGIAGGVAGAVALAIFADALSQALAGMGQEAFNAAVLLLAVGMLAWHNAWMARHGREMAAEMAAVGHAVSSGRRPVRVLAVVVGVAVLREGAETVLFLGGLLTADHGASRVPTALGAVTGLAAGAAAGTLLYLGLVAIPARALFRVTGTMVTLLAAGMAAQAAGFLAAAGLIEDAPPLWDSSSLLAQDSLAGRLLHTLVGYVDRPSPLQLVAWGATIAGITALTRLASAPPARRLLRQPADRA